VNQLKPINRQLRGRVNFGLLRIQRRTRGGRIWLNQRDGYADHTRRAAGLPRRRMLDETPVQMGTISSAIASAPLSL
jgi:hypothetical protein